MKKDKIIAAILAFLLGSLGIHRFYLGQIFYGFLYLLFSCTGIPTLLSIIDGILFLTVSNRDFDYKYNRTF